MWDHPLGGASKVKTLFLKTACSLPSVKGGPAGSTSLCPVQHHLPLWASCWRDCGTWLRKPLIQDLNSQGSTPGRRQPVGTKEVRGQHFGPKLGSGAGVAGPLYGPLPATLGDWSRVAPFVGDMRLGFLIKLQCLFHLGLYFLKMAFLESHPSS